MPPVKCRQILHTLELGPPTIGCWIKKVEEINKMKDLILTAQPKQEKYSKTWRLWNILFFSDKGKALQDP